MPIDEILSEIFEIWPVFLVIAVVVIIVMIVVLSEKKRTKKLKNMTLGSGLHWIENPDEDFIEKNSGFKLFSMGHSRKIYNVSRGRYSNRRWHYFDYKYTTGGGKSSNTFNMTVALVDLEQELPSFVLQDENIFHKIGEILGFKDIDFETHPSFSNNYRLKGDDEDAIRELFSTHILSHFESKEIKYTIEVCSDKMIVYLEKRIPVNDYRQFIEDAANIAKLFLRI